MDLTIVRSSRRHIRLTRMSLLTYPVALTAGLASIVSLESGAGLAFLPIAALFGWTQIGGLCGASHVATMRFLWNARPTTWLKATVAYTTAGLCTSVIVGVIISALGRVFVSPYLGQYSVLMITSLGVLLAAREVQWINFRLPERPCQTDKTWARQFGFVVAAAMWGFHIGLAFATVITYGGFWMLVAIIAARGDIFIGISLLAIYWLGRCLPLWLVPIAEDDDSVKITPRDHLHIRRIHAGALIWLVVINWMTLHR